MMNYADCLFCRIAAGKVPANVIYEDDDVMAFLDISQATRGHALVIAKEHYRSFLSVPAALMHEVMDVARRIAKADVEVLGAKGVNVLTNVNREAGQSIWHFHVHVLPRYGDDRSFSVSFRPNPDLGKIDLKGLAEKLRKAVSES